MSNYPYPEEIQILCRKLEILLDTNKVCRSHGFDHALKVYEHSQKALSSKDTCDLNEKIRKSILIASLLHDADDTKFFPDNYNNENTRFLLESYEKDFVELVVKMINYVSCSKNGDTIPEDALNNPWLLYPRYSDRLEATGEIGIQRCLKYTKTINNPLYLSTTPRAKNEDEIWIIANEKRYKDYKGKSVSMIDHYYDKLLRLGFIQTNNIYYLEESKKRTQPLINVVLKFGKQGYI